VVSYARQELHSFKAWVAGSNPAALTKQLLGAQSFRLVLLDGLNCGLERTVPTFVTSPAQKGLGERCQDPILAGMDIPHRHGQGTPAHNLAQRPGIAEGRDLGCERMPQRVNHEGRNSAQSQCLGMLLLR